MPQEKNQNSDFLAILSFFLKSILGNYFGLLFPPQNKKIKEIGFTLYLTIQTFLLRIVSFFSKWLVINSQLTVNVC